MELLFTMAPATGLQHLRDLELHAQEHAAQVDPEELVHVLRIASVQRAHGALPARVVEREVQSPEAVHRLFDGGSHVALRRHIALHEERLAPVSEDLLGHRVPRFDVHVSDDDARALPREAQGRGRADALAAARDERHASVELVHVSLLDAGRLRP
jgi:hypothetical protein